MPGLKVYVENNRIYARDDDLGEAVDIHEFLGL